METANLDAPEPGTLVAGKYRVGRVLASGGMGIVVEAEHTALGQRVAIKFLRPEAVRQSELTERFIREARAAAGLQTDHVVRVFDIGTDERGLPYMVMELLAGRDLGAEIVSRGPLPVGEAVGYVVEALDAICEAHAAGIVHRDIKPSNLFLVDKPDGSRRIKGLDFGISKFAPSSSIPDAQLTSTKSMLGSPGYMSPEQVRSTKTVDVRTDVWALGVILYELLTGEPAFLGETLGDIFAKIREEDLPAIRTRRPDVPEALGAVLGHCLQRNREQRISDAATLRRRLLPFQGRAMVDSIVDLPATGGADRRSRAELAAAQTLSLEEMAPRVSEAPRLGNETLATWTGGGKSKRRGRVVAGGALALVASGLGIWLLTRSPARGAGRDEGARAPTTGSAAALPGAMAPTNASVSAPLQPVVTASDAPTASATATPTASAATIHAGSTAKLSPHAPPAPTAQPSATPSAKPSATKREDLGI